jgi:hypothetical protein
MATHMTTDEASLSLDFGETIPTRYFSASLSRRKISAIADCLYYMGGFVEQVRS